MKNRIVILFIILSIGISSVFFNSCEKETFYPPSNVDELYSIMNEWYFWIDSIPDINPENYSSPEGLLEAMRYTKRDRWSYITSQESHSQYYVEGTYEGYGFSFDEDADGNVRITFLFDDSVLKPYGVERGWILEKINDEIVVDRSSVSNLLGASTSNKFEFITNLGESKIMTLESRLITMNSVGYVDVIEAGSKKVGYFVFKSFIGPSIDELTEAFNYFKLEGVNELVVDLRYNGGGQINVVTHLANLIIPNSVDKELFMTFEHNLDKEDENESIYFEQNSNSLRLEKVYFITSKGSASASELIINCLDPYIDVLLVGDDTYGKPVGMYTFISTISNLVYAPITFSLVNSIGYGGFYDGLKADSYVSDDISSNFGTGEAVFDEVIYHIEHGSFPSSKTSGEIFRRPFKEIRNIKDEIGAI